MIQVVCTGNRSHREVAMRRFSLGRDPLRPQEYGWREITQYSAALKSSYTFTCRRCGRETRMKVETLRTALDGLHAAGRETLDISRLPF
jgi:hypothetical protein